MNAYEKRMAKYKEIDLKNAEAKRLKEEKKAIKAKAHLTIGDEVVGVADSPELTISSEPIETKWVIPAPSTKTAVDHFFLAEFHDGIKERLGSVVTTNNVVIGLMGKKGSGKDTVADILINEYSFTQKITATNILKKICVSCLGLDKATFEENKDIPFRKPFKFSFSHARAVIETVDQILSTEFKLANGLTKIKSTGSQKFAPREFMTPRQILQFVGTELVQSLYKDFFPKTMYTQFSEKLGGYVITDMRFTQEAGVAHESFQFFYPVKIVGRELPHDGTESHKSENDWEVIEPFFELDNTNMTTLNVGLRALLLNIKNDIEKTQERRQIVVDTNILSPKAYEYLGLTNANSDSLNTSKAKFGPPDENFVVRGWENEE